MVLFYTSLFSFSIYASYLRIILYVWKLKGRFNSSECKVHIILASVHCKDPARAGPLTVGPVLLYSGAGCVCIEQSAASKVCRDRLIKNKFLLKLLRQSPQRHGGCTFSFLIVPYVSICTHLLARKLRGKTKPLSITFKITFQLEKILMRESSLSWTTAQCSWGTVACRNSLRSSSWWRNPSFLEYHAKGWYSSYIPITNVDVF